MPKYPPQGLSKIVNKACLGGLNTFDDPKDIADQECSELLNMIFDDGVIYPRQGTILHRAKPEGETSDPFQMLIATSSDGVDYLIVNYGLNFYLDDTENNQWVKLNQDYTPPTAGLFYGYANWNAGITDDRFYLGNGKDDVMKWIMAVSTLAVAAGAGDSTITLNDSVRFPATGTIIIKGSSGEFTAEYNDNDTETGVLTLTAPVGQIVPIGSTVTTPLIDMSTTIPKGKILITSAGRLFTMNSVGAENTINYSVSGDPEDYSVTVSPNSGGFYTVYHGNGGIINATDFGEYLGIEKMDIILRFDFSYTADNSSFIVTASPIINGDNIGPVAAATTLSYMNVLYYPTLIEGIIAFSPQTTGSQTSSGLAILSQKINNLVLDEINFERARTAGGNQKLFWTCAQPVVGVPESFNNIVLMYDLIRQVWTIFDNWNATDIKFVNDVQYYLSANDGGVYECNVDYQDFIGVNPIAYTTSATTKRFNLDKPDRLERCVYAYVEGYITLNTKFYVDVLFNENGTLGKQTYLIDGADPILVEASLLGGMGRFPMGIPLMGGLDLGSMQVLSQPVFFRAYLELSEAYRPHNVQLHFYSVASGSQYGISAYSLITVPEESIETNLVISPTLNPPIVV